MKKSILTLLLTLLAVLKTYAYDAQIDGICYDFNGTEATVTSVTKDYYYDTIFIPNTVEYNGNSYKVTSIGRYAFSELLFIHYVVLPNSVTSIGEYAFSGCYFLTYISLSDSLKSIGFRAFELCASLTSIRIPKTVESISFNAFRCCPSLESIIVSDNNPVYDSRENCNAIIETATNKLVTGCKNTIIPNSVTSIDNGAFDGCESLTSITIPETVTTIGNGAFNGCSSLTSITIPETVTSIGNSAFDGCSALTSISIPNSVTSIGGSAFFDCFSLTSISIPNSVTSIGDQVFWGCRSLTSINIPNSVTSIGDGTFCSCRSLTYITIPETVRSIGHSAFSGCESLISFTIPKAVTSIANSTFSYCSSLTSITIPEAVTSIGRRAFYECSSLSSIIIPGSVTSIGDEVFCGCSSLTSIVVDGSNAKYDSRENCNAIIETSTNTLIAGCNKSTIPNSVSSIGEKAFASRATLTSIIIPNSVTSISDWAFLGCKSLSTIISEIDDPFPCSDNVFYGLYDKVTLSVPPYSMALYETTDGWKEFENIVPYDVIKKYTALSVKDSQNQDITDYVSILWYDSDAKQIGSGAKLNGVEEGDTLYYSIILDEDLGRKYREVIMQSVVVDSDIDSLICTLKEIPRVELEGRVSATDIDKNPVNVTIRQMLNGKYEQVYTTQTDEQGLFNIEVFDDVTDVILSGDAYFEVPLHRDGFAGNGNLGTIPMNLVSGFAFAADITLKNATTPGAAEEVSELPGGLNNIEFSLSNVTTGEALSDFTVQNGNLIIKSSASIDDEIRLTAKSKQNVFAEATTTVNIEEGANSFALELTELGGIDVTCASSSNGKTIGYLYDANNTLVAKGSYVGESLSLRHLPSGNYTLVTMGSSALLGNLTNLADLNAIGLNECSDFVTASIVVNDGVLSAYSISEVPRMDDSRLYYTTDNAYFSANKASVTAGNYIALSARMDLKPQYQEKVNDVLLTVDLPEGCQLVENSVIANRQAVAYTCNDNKLMMNIGQEQWQDEIRFCVIPTLNQTYAITAMASFDIDGEVSQPIGTAQFESKGLSLITPSQTVDTNITINGTAKANSEVSIYDNGVLIGKTTSKADGTWSASCELYKTFSHSFHDIYAKIETENGLELTSETKQVEYNKNMITPKSVTMTFYNGWYKENKTVEFNLIEGTTSPTSWPFYSAADFTFLADFTKNDSTLVKNVNIKVLNSDGTVRTLPATFDGKHGKWVATTKYSSSSRLPQNVTVEYDLIPVEVPFDPSVIDEDNNQYKNIIQNYVMNADSSKCEVLEATDSKVVCKYQTYTMDSPVIIQMEKLNYHQLIREFETKEHLSIDNDGVIINIVDSVLNEKNMQWIWIDAERSMVYVEISAAITNAKTSIKKANIFEGDKTLGSLLKTSLLNLFFNAGDIINITNDFNAAHTDLHYWLSMYDQTLNNHMQLYKKTLQLIEAKCPDGSFRLSTTAYNSAKKSLKENFDDATAMRQQFNSNLNRVEREISRRRDFASMQSACWSLVGIVPSVKTEVQGIGDFLRFLADDVVSNLGTTTASDAYGHLIENTFNTFYTTDKLSEWYFPANREIINKYIILQTSIQNAYKLCEKKKEDNGDKEERNDEPLDEKSDNKPNFNGNGSKGIVDPSGYVYEAVLSNRLEGVTATCYQLTQVEDMYGDITEEAVVWNAEDYSQQNPVKTDKYGFYRWDVPQGMWQVKYEKEGYETVYSGWLPVPPPQLDVNVAMKQSTPPTVTQMRGTESGITIDMTKYMLPATMTTANITVTRNGKPEQGTIEMLNAEQAPLSGETYVQKVKFVPDSRFSVSDIVVVTVHKDVKSYCGITMTADHQETVKIESEISNIVVDAEITVPYRGERELRVLVLPREAAAGRKLLVNTSSSMIASVSANELIVEEDGSATLTLGGELPGGAVIEFAIDGSDVMTSSIIQVKDVADMVAPPMASIPSGEVVAKGTQIELSCETPGATIYYTLDGSCPCDEAARLVYTTPIVINESVMIKAMAVAPDMEDSEIAEFSYIVTPIVGIDAATLDETIKVFPLPVRDKLNVTAGGKMIKSVTLVSTNGSVVAKAAKPETIVTLDVRSLAPSIYFVNVATEDKNYSRKIMKVE